MKDGFCKEEKLDTIRSDTEPSRRASLLPPLPISSESLVDECAARISETPDLFTELQKRGIEIRQLAGPIARAEQQRALWEEANQQKAKAKAYATKLQKRHRDKLPEKYTREERLRTLTRAASKRLFASEEVRRLKRSSTKKRPYLIQLLVVLYHILSDRTNQPYRYMAGLFNLFNLRPENTCSACLEFSSTKRRCKNSRIFDCPHHETTRHSLWHLTKNAMKEFPDLRTRIKDPENQIV